MRLFKDQWSYRISTDPAQRDVLRSLWAPLLAFENHSLALCAPLIEQAVRSVGVESREGAARCLSRIRYEHY